MGGYWGWGGGGDANRAMRNVDLPLRSGFAAEPGEDMLNEVEIKKSPLDESNTFSLSCMGKSMRCATIVLPLCAETLWQLL